MQGVTHKHGKGLEALRAQITNWQAVETANSTAMTALRGDIGRSERELYALIIEGQQMIRGLHSEHLEQLTSLQGVLASHNATCNEKMEQLYTFRENIKDAELKVDKNEEAIKQIDLKLELFMEDEVF